MNTDTTVSSIKKCTPLRMNLKSMMQGRLGFGSAPLGNMFRNISEEEATATVDAAWENGIRYFDTAPSYGAGLSEIRIGEALSKHHRDDYLLSTKVGRYILDELEDPSFRDLGEKSGLFQFGSKNKIVSDYSTDATLRSIEQSLKRLKTDRLDIVYIHDVAQDIYGEEWLAQFEIARTGAFRVLSRLRDEGVIKSWGLGVNRVEPIEIALELDEADPDVFLLAGRYTLLDHEYALQRLMPTAANKNIDIIVGGPYNSGILVGGTHFEYQKASPEVISKVERIKSIAQRHQISIKAAALQFSLANPAVTAVIPGASRPERITEDKIAENTIIPSAFWQEMREQNLVSPNAPLPVNSKKE